MQKEHLNHTGYDDLRVLEPSLKQKEKLTLVPKPTPVEQN